LISCLTDKNYDLLEQLLNGRQSLINEMTDMNYSQKDFELFCNELSIVKLQSELDTLMNKAMDDTKLELKKIRTTKNVNNNYNKSTYVDSIFVYKKI
jgi:division protein CdvB (Snf7/Vps24/ESCRT-III family)